ncbi:lytic transglycosylase domain-containing protein [Acidithiobacillus sp.]|jgi:type IV secretion system protein VirB1
MDVEGVVMIPVASLATQCAPMVATSTMAAVVQHESGGNPLAMWDNTTGRRYLPSTVQQAVLILRHLLAEGQQVDVGIAQVDSENFQHYGLTVRSAFNACTNIHVGGKILQAAWFQAKHAGLHGQTALFHAFEAYNSGGITGDGGYARAIYRAAGIPTYVHVSRGYRYNYEPLRTASRRGHGVQVAARFSSVWAPASNWQPKG